MVWVFYPLPVHLVWICFTSMFGVYFTTRNVSYGQGSLLAWVSSDSLLWNGTESMALVMGARARVVKGLSHL